MRTLVIDNYDSFTYNLVQLVGELDGEAPLVFRNDALTVAEALALSPDRVILSPGPGTPEDPAYFGVCGDVLRVVSPRVPTLGVCLGHQGIGLAFGARVVRAPRVVHGKTSRITHEGGALYEGVPRVFEAMRYHSLALDPTSIPACLEVTARADDGVIMGVSHVSLPIHGVQFHPESIGSPYGRCLVQNFLARGARAKLSSSPRFAPATPTGDREAS